MSGAKDKDKLKAKDRKNLHLQNLTQRKISTKLLDAI